MPLQNDTQLWTLYGVINREIITATIAGCGDVMSNQDVSKAEIIPELIPIQLLAIEAMGHGTKACPIPYCTMEDMPIFPSRQILPSCQLRNLPPLPIFYFCRTCPAYECPMAYVVEVGNS